jgi:hypothetical protein
MGSTVRLGVADIVNNLSWRPGRCGPTLKT